MTTRRTLSLLAASAPPRASSRSRARADEARRQGKAARARRAAPVQAPRADALHAPERPEGLARPLRHGPEGARPPHGAGRATPTTPPARPGWPTSRATSSSRARRRAARRRSRRTPASMGGEVAVNAGENLTTVGGEVLSEFAPAMVELVADVARNPVVPRVRARAPEGQPRAPALHREEPVAADGHRGVPRRDVPGPVVRPHLPGARRDQGLHAREREGVLDRPLRRRPRHALRRRRLRREGDRGRDPQGLRRLGQGVGARGGGAEGRPRSAPSRSSTAPAPRSPRSSSGCPSSTPRTPTTSRSSS